MKILSVLLLLAVGVGAAWWKITWPEGTVVEVRAEATLAAERLREQVVRVRERVSAAARERMGGAASGTATGLAPDAAPDVATAVPDATGALPDGTPPAPTPPADTGVLLARLADVERRLDAAARRESAMRRELETLRARPDSDEPASATGDGDAPDTPTDGAPTPAPPPTPPPTPPPGLPPGLDARLAALDARLGTLPDDLDARLGALEGRLDALGGDDARLGTLEERLDTLDRRLGALADTASVDPVSVDEMQSELQDRLAVLNERVDGETDGEEAPALDAALARTRERLALLEARVQQMPESSPAADDALATQASLARQVRELGQRLESLASGADPAIADSISEVRDQVDALESRGFVTREELREQTAGRNVEYKIYFERGSTEVSPAAARVLDSFIAQEKNRTTGVSIYGFTDRQGSATYNQRLALERATNVRSYLIQNGLPYTKIRALNGLGEDAAAAILPDEAEDAQQRVVVLFAAQP